MAWLYQDPLSKNFRICFRLRGRAYKKTLKTKKFGDADIIRGGVERTLFRLEQNLLEMPPDADVVTFVLSDGKQAAKATPRQTLTVKVFRDDYLSACSNGSMEKGSLETTKIHFRHFIETLGESFGIAALKLGDLQRHVDRRAKAKGIRKRLLSPTTIRKEVASLRAAWNWGVQAGLVAGPFPHRGLKYPKGAEKPPFQSWEEIEREIQAGMPDQNRRRDLWDCLYLTPQQIDELPRFVKTRATHRFLYPMFMFAAHTGARRSEMLRARVTDIDFTGMTVLLREKKRARGQTTSRRIPLSPLLVAVLRDWVGQHPGGDVLFCHEPRIARSSKVRTAGVPLTRNEAQDHFHRPLAGSKWAVLRGWHVLRHSFASNCAAAGVDQQFINAWMGHQTEDMVRRYQHLRPDKQAEAIGLVFGR